MRLERAFMGQGHTVVQAVSKPGLSGHKYGIGGEFQSVKGLDFASLTRKTKHFRMMKPKMGQRQVNR